MNRRSVFRSAWLVALCSVSFVPRASAQDQESRYLYVAVPGIRDYLEFGGHGVLVFDIDHDHKFVKRIKAAGLKPDGKPDNVKGVCASAKTGLMHVSTTKTVTCFDLKTDKILWEKPYEGGTDRMALSPDGKTIYQPSFESDHWNVISATDGAVIAKITPKSGSHNTVFGLDGKHVYLAGLKSPLLTVADATRHVVEKTVGPFSAEIRPFTVNGAQTRCYVNVNRLLGFEIGDLETGKKICVVEVEGFSQGPVKRHGCPSHGIGLTPDEKEIWIADAHNRRMHVFDATVMPPKQLVSIPVREEPGWVTFSIDGRYAYPSTGEVIEVASKRIATALADEHNAPVHSEKMVEIDFSGGSPVRTGDQFGVGRVLK